MNSSDLSNVTMWAAFPITSRHARGIALAMNLQLSMMSGASESPTTTRAVRAGLFRRSAFLPASGAGGAVTPKRHRGVAPA